MNSTHFGRRLGFAVVVGFFMFGNLPPAEAQSPPPKATIVDDEPTPGTLPPAPVPRPKRAEPVPDEPLPEEPPRRAKPAPAPASKPAVRPAPAQIKSAEDELFDLCELLFSRRNFIPAIRQYEEYLKLFPNGKHLQEARFKLGECHYSNSAWEVAIMELDSFLKDFPSNKNRVKALYHAGESHYNLASSKTITAVERAEHLQTASQAYRAVHQITKRGPIAAYAAVRLGTLAYNAAEADPERYKEAIQWFTLAAAQAPREQPKIRYFTLFLKGRSCRFIGADKEATAAFEEVVRGKADKENEYYEKALLELAGLDVEAGRQEAAMKKFEILAKESAAVETRAQSMVNAGMIHAKAGRPDEAFKHFEEASKVKGAPIAQTQARYGLAFAYFKQKTYDKVIDAWRGIGDYSTLDDAARAQLLLIVGTCYAAIDQHLRASEIFNILEQSLPESGEAHEGGYKRLVSLFKLNEKSTPENVADYVERWRERNPQSEFLDKAWLVRAAYYFNRSMFGPAAEAYQRVRQDKLEPTRLSTYLYQRGYSEASSKDKEAVTTLTQFIEKFPQDERLAMAVHQRGVAEFEMGDYPGAIRDFETIRNNYPKSEAAESATYRLAKAKAYKQDHAGTVADFQRLLKDFPETKAAAEAWFWIGDGLFRQKKYKESIEPLRKAREKDPKTYSTDASMLIIQAFTGRLAEEKVHQTPWQKDLDSLMEEVDKYLKGPQEKKISPLILTWLGRTTFLERKDFRATSRYLSPVANYDSPGSTPKDVWAILGESQVENGSFESAIVALDHQLSTEENLSAQAKAHMLKGRAYLGLNKPDEATKSAEDGLTIDKETLLSAQLRIVLGEAALARKNYTEAYTNFNNVITGWEDATYTPIAMDLLIETCEKSGNPDYLAMAVTKKAELAKRFPRYQRRNP